MNLLMAVVLLLQDKTAEETFKKIEEMIEKAKSVSVQYKVEGINGERIKGEKAQIPLTMLKYFLESAASS